MEQQTFFLTLRVEDEALDKPREQRVKAIADEIDTSLRDLRQVMVEWAVALEPVVT